MSEAAAGRRRSIVPPEGVPLELHVAQAGDRLAAFLFDAMLQILVLIGIFLLLAMAARGTGGAEGTMVIGILAFFLIRSFYFIWFESRWQGRTPGKRMVGIRVIVDSKRLSDEKATWLSRDIAGKIENELTYPGQIKVTVIRETRSIEYAK